MSDQWFLDQSRLGNVYSACSAGAVTLSTVSATCTGLALSNPVGSGYNLVVKSISFAPSTAPAGASVVGLAVSQTVHPTAVVHTTPMVIHRTLLSGSNANAGVGRCDAAATLPEAPVWFKPLASVVAASSISPTNYTYHANGDIIVTPGTFISLSYLTTAAVGIASIVWAEVKI